MLTMITPLSTFSSEKKERIKVKRRNEMAFDFDS